MLFSKCFRMQHPRVSLFVLVAAVAATHCTTPRPSAEPLGWGPLPRGAFTAAPPAKARTATGAEPTGHSRKEEAKAFDAGGSGTEKIAAVPSAPASATAEKEPSPKAPPPSSAAVKEFIGEYAGEDVATYRISGLPDRTERDPKARISVKTGDKSDVLLFVLIDSSNGKEICSLSGSMNDAAVAIDAGQKCFEQNEAEASTGATVTKGKATFDKKRLSFQLDLDFEMNVEGRKLSGTLEYHFDGKRQ
jgi:hypothetical protein